MKKIALIELVASMFIFGTIGVFVRYINMPSGFIAMIRGALGVLFSVSVALIGGRRISFSAIKQNLLMLLLCGAAIGVNWILLFESYRYTTVATATLCYYMAPIFVILMSPIFISERIGIKRAVCVLTAIVGMVLVSGVAEQGFGGIGDFRGILLGLGAALLYASVTVMNKKLKDISSQDRTAVQLFFATVVILPYTVFFEDVSPASFTPIAIVMLAVLGVVHTGLAYMLYFSSIRGLKASTVAIFAYADPIVAILLSALFLDEPMSLPAVLGAVLIILSTMLSELPIEKAFKYRTEK